MKKNFSNVIQQVPATSYKGWWIVGGTVLGIGGLFGAFQLGGHVREKQLKPQIDDLRLKVRELAAMMP